MTCSAIPKSWQRCVTSASISSKVSGIEQQRDALARGELARLVLTTKAVLTAAKLGETEELAEAVSSLTIDD